MGFRLGLLVGLGVGYYMGARAGREHYEMINQVLERARGSEAAELALDKLRATLDLGVERLRDVAEREIGAG